MQSLTDPLAHQFTSYRPQMPTQYWHAIGSFVRAAVTDSTPGTHELFRRTLGFTSQYVLWCWQSCGLPLKREEIFTTALVEGYCAAHTTSGSAKVLSRQRTLLLRVVAALSTDPASIAPAQTSDSERLAPYTRPELASLRSWALGQPTAQQRHNAAVILSLGAGCGLRPAEIRTLTVEQVSGNTEGVTVHTGSRSVPVQAIWEPALRQALDAADTHLFITSGRRHAVNTLNAFIASSSGIELKPLTQRLRATWIVAQLQAQTPLPALIEAAGISTLFSLSPYLRYLESSAAADNAALRNAGSR